MAAKKSSANKKLLLYTRKKIYKDIKKDLLEQLELNGTLGAFYTDLIDDYMDFWVTKCMLIEDIHERGPTVEYDNGGGQKGKKKNDSIEQLIKVNAQMMRILSEIGIKPSDSVGDESDL
nr:P27 family phage terminase small subunit [uncultured Aminipila sp.]